MAKHAKVALDSFPPNLIVACCGQKCANCCWLRPNFHLLRVAGYLHTTQVDEIQQYVHVSISYVLQYAFVCGQKCANCCWLRPNFHLLRVAGYLHTTQVDEIQQYVHVSISYVLQYAFVCLTTWLLVNENMITLREMMNYFRFTICSRGIKT